MDEVYLKILSDIHCEVYVDNELMAIAKKNSLTKIPLRKGEYLIVLMSTVNTQYRIEKVISIECDKVLEARFIDLAKSHPEWESENDWRFYKNQRTFKNLITNKILPIEVERADEFKNGVSRVWIMARCGYINTTGNIIVPCVYDAIGEFNFSIDGFPNGITWAKRGGKEGYIDVNGNILIPFKYSYAAPFGPNGIAPVKREGYAGYIDVYGNEIVPLFYSQTNFFYKGFARIKDNNKYGLLNSYMEEVIPCTYDEIGNMEEDLVRAERDGLYGFLNGDGDSVIPFRYENAEDFCEGLAAVRFDTKCGYIDKNGHFIIPNIYDDAHSFNNGKAIVWKDGEGYGVVNSIGYELVPCQYKKVKDFYNGYIGVQVTWREWSVLNHECEEVMNVSGFDEVDFYSDSDLVRVKVSDIYDDRKSLFGFINHNNVVIIPVIFDECIISGTVICAIKDNTTYYFDKYGNEM